MSVVLDNGYRLIYRPKHPNSRNDGWMYEHTWVMSENLKRPLRNNEVVHHLDCNRHNNRLNNLIVLERGQHNKIHQWIDSGCHIHDSYQVTETRFNKFRIIKSTYCKNCQLTLQHKQKHYCSRSCRNKYETKNSKCPSLEQLQEDLNGMTWTAIGKKYGVSDNCIRKWAKKLKLEKT